MANAFDADIKVGESGPTLYYVVAKSGTTPDAAVRSVGGQIVSRLTSEEQVLALAPLAVHTTLRDHPDLATAGPVTIDPERFNRFVEMVAQAYVPKDKSASQSKSNEIRIGETK
jgi:hypothetical protein